MARISLDLGERAKASPSEIRVAALSTGAQRRQDARELPSPRYPARPRVLDLRGGGRPSGSLSRLYRGRSTRKCRPPTTLTSVAGATPPCSPTARLEARRQALPIGARHRHRCRSPHPSRLAPVGGRRLSPWHPTSPRSRSRRARTSALFLVCD